MKTRPGRPAIHVTNEIRADWALAAVEAFAAEHGPQGDPVSALRDLLCNMLHAARALGLSPERTMRGALEVFHEEEAEEKEP